jgi:hypothetical protein
MKVPVKQERAQLRLTKNTPFAVEAIPDVQDIPATRPLLLCMEGPRVQPENQADYKRQSIYLRERSHAAT